MKNQIEALSLPNSLNGLYEAIANDAGNTEGSMLNGLSHINVFVGPNNSGKSRLLRGIMTAEKLRFIPTDYSRNIPEAAKILKTRLSSLGGANANVAPFQTEAVALSDYELINEGEDFPSALHSFIQRSKSAKQSDLSISYSGSAPSSSVAVSTINSAGIEAENKLGSAFDELLPKYNFKRIYLPTLRGLRTIGGNADIYKERTENDYFKDLKVSVETFTGLGFYEEVRDMLLGDRKQRRLVQDFERFLSENLFEGQGVTLIPRKGKDVVFVRIGREPELPVYELGDGVQHLIILTFPLFKYQETSSLVFIEEPELFRIRQI